MQCQDAKESHAIGSPRVSTSHHYTNIAPATAASSVAPIPYRLNCSHGVPKAVREALLGDVVVFVVVVVVVDWVVEGEVAVDELDDAVVVSLIDVIEKETDVLTIAQNCSVRFSAADSWSGQS